MSARSAQSSAIVISAGGVIGVTVLMRTATSNASFCSGSASGVARRGIGGLLSSRVRWSRTEIGSPNDDVDVAA